MWFVASLLILLWYGGELPDLAKLEGDALSEAMETFLFAQAIGSVVALALALKLRLPMSWIGRGRLGGTVLSYLLFMVFWVPVAMILYPWCLSLLGIELQPQPHLAYFTSGHRGFGFYAAIGTICVLGPIVEEVVFRGYLQTGIHRLWGKWAGLLLASLAFGLIHGLEFALPLAMMGAYFGYQRDRTDGLVAPCLAHMLHNSVTVIVTVMAPQVFDLVYSR